MFDLRTRRLSLDSRAREGVKTRLSAILRSVGLRQSLITGISMILAGGFDYGVNVVAGRWLEPIEYGVFISVSAILQALLLPAIAIRVVVAFYTVELSARDSSSQVGAFLMRVWRWAWQWGLVAAILLAIISPPLARSLRLPNSWPLWAASLMVLMLFLRESTYGVLQGTQAFTGLGLAQVIQALLRLLFAAGLIWSGWRAAGAILAQPVGCIVALILAVLWLRPHFKDPDKIAGRPVCWRYSARTLLGLAVFGVLTNLDALFVKHYFTPRIAGDYGPVVTLAKVSLFLPWAIGIVLLPKVMQRQAAGRDARPILLLALAGALAPGLGVTTLYILFTSAYPNPGMVLGLASLAATLYAGLYIWLNYALSVERPAFVYALIGVLAWQGLGMYLFGRESLIHMTLVMVSASLIGNIAGFITTWLPIQKSSTVGAEIVGS